MKLTAKCSCGCIVTMEEEIAVFADPSNPPLGIEVRMDAWQGEHRACWRWGAPTIHRLFSGSGPRIYKGAALDSPWKRMSPADRRYHVAAVVLGVVAALILLFR